MFLFEEFEAVRIIHNTVQALLFLGMDIEIELALEKQKKKPTLNNDEIANIFKRFYSQGYKFVVLENSKARERRVKRSLKKRLPKPERSKRKRKK